MSFTRKGLTFFGIFFLVCCWAITFLKFFTLSVPTISLTQIQHPPTDSSTFPTGRWIFGILSTLSIFYMGELWIPLLFSKRRYMAGRRSFFPRRKVNLNVQRASGFENSASWTRSNGVKQKYRTFTSHRGDLKRVDWWEKIRSTASITPPFVWS